MSRNFFSAVLVGSFLSLSANMAASAPPSFWHYYYAYSEPMETCSRLLREVMEDVQRNWDLNGGDLNRYNGSFRAGDTRGFMRCLQRGPNSSWVVLITTGGGNRAKQIFGDMKVRVCGDC